MDAWMHGGSEGGPREGGREGVHTNFSNLKLPVDGDTTSKLKSLTMSDDLSFHKRSLYRVLFTRQFYLYSYLIHGVFFFFAPAISLSPSFFFFIPKPKKKRDPGIEVGCGREVRAKIFSLGLSLRSNIGYLPQKCKELIRDKHGQ